MIYLLSDMWRLAPISAITMLVFTVASVAGLLLVAWSHWTDYKRAKLWAVPCDNYVYAIRGTEATIDLRAKH